MENVEYFAGCHWPSASGFVAWCFFLNITQQKLQKQKGDITLHHIGIMGTCCRVISSFLFLQFLLCYIYMDSRPYTALYTFKLFSFIHINVVRRLLLQQFEQTPRLSACKKLYEHWERYTVSIFKEAKEASHQTRSAFQWTPWFYCSCHIFLEHWLHHFSWKNCSKYKPQAVLVLMDALIRWVWHYKSLLRITNAENWLQWRQWLA